MIEPSWAFIRTGRSGYTIGQKQILYLKNGNEYVIKANLLDGDFDMFTNIVKKITVYLLVVKKIMIIFDL